MKKYIWLYVLILLLNGPFAYAYEWNPLDKNTSVVLSNSNMTATFPTTGDTVKGVRADESLSGKVYWEYDLSSNGLQYLGVTSGTRSLSASPTSAADAWMYDPSTGQFFHWDGGTLIQQTYSTAAVGDVIGFAVDISEGDMWISINGSWQGGGSPAAGTSPAVSSLTGTLYPAAYSQNNTEKSIILYTDNTESTAPTGFDYYAPPAYVISGVLKQKESDATGGAYEYFILDTTSSDLYEYGTAGASGAYTVTVANGTDEYCGVIIDNIGGAVYSGNYGTDTTDGSGDWSITNANWSEGDTVWAFFIDPDKVYKTIAADFLANASHTISDRHNEAGSPVSGTQVYAFSFGTSSGTYKPNPIFDFATGETE